MGYGLFKEYFEKVEKNIDKGLHEQALEFLKKIRKNNLGHQQKTYYNILFSDIHSHLGQFHSALTLQYKIINSPLPEPLLRSIAFQSHAFTLGYTGRINEAQKYFELSKETACRLKRKFLFYSSEIGMIDIEFHDYEYDRFNPDHNVSLFNKIGSVLQNVSADVLLQEEDPYNKKILVSLLNFRKAVLLWLNRDYTSAENAFEITNKFSDNFFKVWALFGLINCSQKNKDQQNRWKQELEKALKIKAWRKNAMKYWPVALLLGKTWQLMGQNEKAQSFYRDILLKVRVGYTDQKIASNDYSVFITRYFYPVYREAATHYLGIDSQHSKPQYRYALNRAEMFRARFLSEEYKKHHNRKKVENILTSNVRIDETGALLSNRFKKDVFILYCFDFKNSGLLLLSKDLSTDYRKIEINTDDYKVLKSFSRKPVFTIREINIFSKVFKELICKINTGHLLIIPHGIFNHVPFHALKKDSGHLIKNTLVNYWPSLQMAVLGEHEKQINKIKITCIGTRDDPASRDEIDQLAAKIKNCRVFYDPEIPVIKKALSIGDSLLHVVAHGQINSSKNDITVIRINGKNIEFGEIVKNIENLPEIILLNVCYGGYTGHTDADFIQGLPVTFFQKGTEALIVSRRRLSQQISTEFSQCFYHHFSSGDTLGKAYQKAIVKLVDNKDTVGNIPCLMGNSMIKVSL